MYCIYMLLILSLVSCINDKKKAGYNPVEQKDKGTNLLLFGDSVNIINLEFLDTSEKVIVSLINKKKSTSQHLIDTLNAYKLEYDTTDFNNDGVADLLILKTVYQSNPVYYLYVVDVENKKLKFVKDFEKIYTPVYNKENNIIISYLRNGIEQHYAFFKLNKNLELIDLHKSFKTDNEGKADSLLNSVIKGLK